MNLPENLTLLRSHYKLNLEDVASSIGISRQTLAKYEKGQAMPPVDVAGQLAVLYKVSLDVLTYHPLSRFNSRQLQDFLSAPDFSFRGKSLRVRSLVHTVSPDDKELIEVVPMKAAMGYAQGGFNDDRFIADLPKIQLPEAYVNSNRSYRLFPTEGDSMLPIPDGAHILGEYVTDWYSVKTGLGYIFVLKDEGIVFKKAVNELQEKEQFGFQSLNPMYQTYYRPADEVAEIWKYTMHMTHLFPDPEPSMSLLLSEIRAVKTGQEELLKRVP